MKLSAWLATKGLFVLLPYRSAAFEPEQSLWRAVLDNAVRDLASSDKEAAQEAKEWFESKDADFQFVCDAAGLDFDFVVSIYETKLRHLAKHNIDVSFLKKYLDREKSAK